MRRRRYLALLTVTFAGCNSASDGGDTPAADGTGTRTATREPTTRTSAPTTTDSRTTTTEPPTETEPTTATETETRTETEPSTPEPETDDHVAAARDALSAAYDAYLTQAGDEDSLEFVETGSTFDEGAVRRRTAAADAALDRAASSDPSNSQESLVGRLRDVSFALDRLATAESAAATGYRSVERAFEAVYTDEDVGAARQALRNAENAAAGISTAINALRTDVRPRDFETVSFIDGREYGQRRDQLEDFEDTLESDLPDRLSALGPGVGEFGDGVDAYGDENYAAASGSLDDAVERFDAVRSEWEELDPAGSLDELVETFQEVLTTLGQGTEDLSEAATAFQADSGAVEQLQAKRTYRENDTVAAMPTVQRALEL